MCTVTWLRTDEGYELFFNRDERRTRGPAFGPALYESGGVRYVAPLDSDHGGTWTGVNQDGLSLSLLNYYEGWRPLPDARSHRSRGLLLRELLGCRSPAEVRARVSATRLDIYRPFTILILTPGRMASSVRWTGRRTHFDEAAPVLPLTSSSFAPSDVAFVRQEYFRRFTHGGVSAATLLDFHRSHEPARGPYSICMHREDAATVSFSHIKVAGRLIEFSYLSQPPCLPAPPQRITLIAGDARLAGAAA